MPRATRGENSSVGWHHLPIWKRTSSGAKNPEEESFTTKKLKLLKGTGCSASGDNPKKVDTILTDTDDGLDPREVGYGVITKETKRGKRRKATCWEEKRYKGSAHNAAQQRYGTSHSAYSLQSVGVFCLKARRR